MISARELATIVASLMDFYARTPADPEIRQAQFEMFWLPELGEFEVEIIRQACAEWQRRPVKEAPTPGQLRTICVELRSNADWRRDRALPKPDAPEKWMSELWREGGMKAREAAIRAREERYRAAAQWRQEQAAAVRAGKPVAVTAATLETQKRPTPQWIVERDRQRAEAREKALGLGEIDKMVDRYVADSAKRVPDQPEDIDPPAVQEDAA